MNISVSTHFIAMRWFLLHNRIRLTRFCGGKWTNERTDFTTSQTSNSNKNECNLKSVWPAQLRSIQANCFGQCSCYRNILTHTQTLAKPFEFMVYPLTSTINVWIIVCNNIIEWERKHTHTHQLQHRIRRNRDGVVFNVLIQRLYRQHRQNNRFEIFVRHLNICMSLTVACYLDYSHQRATENACIYQIFHGRYMHKIPCMQISYQNWNFSLFTFFLVWQIKFYFLAYYYMVVFVFVFLVYCRWLCWYY